MDWTMNRLVGVEDFFYEYLEVQGKLLIRAGLKCLIIAK